MADIRCGGSHIEIETDQSLDVDGNSYIQAVTVTIGTTSKDGTLIRQTNKLTLKTLTKVKTVLSLSLSLSLSLARAHSRARSLPTSLSLC